MKATTLLKNDHTAVKKLFADFGRTTARAAKRRQALIDQIAQELEIHSTIEEEIFYPAVKNVRGGQSLVSEAKSEHETNTPNIEVTYATYRCALRCGGAGGFERAGLGRLEVYSRRDWIRRWKRVRDDDLRADQGHVLRSRRNWQRTDRDRVAADGGQSGDGDLWRVLDGDSRHDARPRESRIRREYHSPPDERPPVDAHIADRGAIGDSRSPSVPRCGR